MRLYAHLSLVAAAAFWGFGNIFQKGILNHMGPMTATCLRCMIATLAVLPFLWFERRIPRDGAWWLSAAGVALTFAIAISIEQTAYLSSSVTNASFLVNTATILTPIFAWLLLREATAGHSIGAAVVTMVGVLLMSNGLAGFVGFRRGDAACLISAAFYAVWMVALGRHAQRHGSPIACAIVQFAVTCVTTFTASTVAETGTAPDYLKAWPELVGLGLLATAAPYCIQTVAQRYTTASKAALLVSGESVFGAIGAYLWLGERPGSAVLVGATMIAAAIVVIAISPSGDMAEQHSPIPTKLVTDP